jgi:DNA-binding beta-propeller fold protein YncE
MKRLITNCTKHNKKQKLPDSKLCKIIDTIYIKQPRNIIQTPCGKFLIGIEGDSIYKYCLETKQKFRIAGSVNNSGHQNGPRDESRFHWPCGLTLSKNLKTLFVSDSFNHVIRVVCVETGITTTFARQVGKPNHVDGPKEKACFICPRKLKLSPDGNTLLVSDLRHLCSICIATGQVRTIDKFHNQIRYFTFSSDGKHVYILINRIFRFNLETGESELILKCKVCNGMDISKNGQLLFVSSKLSRYIKVINLVTNKVIDTITLPWHFKSHNLLLSTNNKHLYVCCNYNNKIIILDISKYCSNFKTFTQSQLSKYSFLYRAVVKRLKI